MGREDKKLERCIALASVIGVATLILVAKLIQWFDIAVQ